MTVLSETPRTFEALSTFPNVPMRIIPRTFASVSLSPGSSVAWGAIMPFTAIRMDSSMKSMNGSELFRLLDSAKAE